MGDRETKVSLKLYYQQYVDGMEKVAKATAKTKTEADKLAETRKHFDLIGKSALAAGALVGVGLAAAVAKAAQFDQAISGIQAATHASAAEMDKYRQAALKAGADTVFSATESADAITELAKAGLSSAAILGGGLTGALNLAAASGMGVADAAGVAATTLQQFQLKGSQASHVADLLAAGAGKAMGDVSDLSQALAQSGTVAAQFGLSVDETVGTLSAFASAGLLGSDAGTSFRTMLLRLANPTGQAADEMKKLGINAYDASGKFVGMAGLAGQLQAGLKGLTQEQQNASLAIIFGQDAIRGANVLFKDGAKGIEDWTNKVNDQGYAAKTAAIQMDNLKGDIEQLKGSLETALISMGEGAQGPLRTFAQAITNLINGFNDLPGPVKEATAGVAGLAAAGLAAFGAYLLLVPKIAQYQAALATLGPTAQKTGVALSTMAKGIGALAIAGAVVGGVSALADVISKQFLPSAEETGNKVKTATSGIGLFTAALSARGLYNAAGQAKAQLSQFGDVLDEVAKSDFWSGPILNDTYDTMLELGKQLGKLAGSDLPAAQAQFRKLAEDAGLTKKQQIAFIEGSSELKDALTEQASAAGLSASKNNLLKIAQGQAEDSAKDNTSALKSLAGQATDTGDSVDDLADRIRGFGSATLDTRDAQRKFEQAIDDLAASVKENGHTLDIATQKGRDNQSAVDDLAKSTLDLAAATYTQTGSQEAAAKVLADGRQKLIDMLGQFGITGKAAQAYVDKLGLIPANIATLLKLNKTPAEVALDEFLARVRNLPRLTIGIDAVPRLATTGTGSQIARAGGGEVSGPGTGTSDSIPARLSNGEHVLTASDVRVMGGQQGVYRFRQGLHQGSYRYASGGAVIGSSSTAPSSPMSLDGLAITGTLQIGGDGLARIIDGRITAADAKGERTIMRG